MILPYLENQKANIKNQNYGLLNKYSFAALS